MTDHSAIEAATKRLLSALDTLEAAVDRRLDAGVRDAHLADQVHTLDADRARLAAELDNTAARAKTLEVANRAIAKRLDDAMDAIRSVIAAQDE